MPNDRRKTEIPAIYLFNGGSLEERGSDDEYEIRADWTDEEFGRVALSFSWSPEELRKDYGRPNARCADHADEKGERYTEAEVAVILELFRRNAIAELFLVPFNAAMETSADVRDVVRQYRISGDPAPKSQRREPEIARLTAANRKRLRDAFRPPSRRRRWDPRAVRAYVESLKNTYREKGVKRYSETAKQDAMEQLGINSEDTLRDILREATRGGERARRKITR